MIGFKKWLIKNYLHQNNRFGDLAMDVNDDPVFPEKETSKYALEDYLKCRDACSACMDVFYELWEHYRDEMGITVKYQIIIFHCGSGTEIDNKKFNTLEEAKKRVIELYKRSNRIEVSAIHNENYKDPEDALTDEDRYEIEMFLTYDEKTFHKYEIAEIYK